MSAGSVKYAARSSPAFSHDSRTVSPAAGSSSSTSHCAADQAGQLVHVLPDAAAPGVRDEQQQLSFRPGQALQRGASSRCPVGIASRDRW